MPWEWGQKKTHLNGSFKIPIISFRCAVHWAKQKVYNFLCGTLVDKKNFDPFGVATQGWCKYKINLNDTKNKKNLSDKTFRCTDGIVFVVDSVDVERMEEAKMELMRTAKCSENHVSIAILTPNAFPNAFLLIYDF